MKRFAVLLAVAIATGLAADWAARSFLKPADKGPDACLVLTQAWTLQAALPRALGGDAKAFTEIATTLNALGTPAHLAAAVPDGESSQRLQTSVQGIKAAAELLLSRQATLVQAHEARRIIGREAGDLLELAEHVVALELQAAAPPARIMASSQLAMMTQRIAKSAGDVLGADMLQPEALMLLGKDTANFSEIALGLRDGNAALRLLPATDPAEREQVGRLLARFEQTGKQAGFILSSLKELATAREAQLQMLSNAQAMSQIAQQVCRAPQGPQTR